MRIHALQTGTVAIKQRQRQGKGQGLRRRLNTLLDTVWTEPLPIYVWVIEHPEGIIVVDTGETSRVAVPGYFPWWHPYYRTGVREWVRPEEEVGPQLHALGIGPSDVRWLVMTHLHTDHAGGLYHFPSTDILVSRTEYQMASGVPGQVHGYLPTHWPTWFAPRLIDFPSRQTGPFPASYPVTQAGDVVLVPTPGHTSGHLSVLVYDGSTAIFLAGDASYTQQLLFDGVVDGVAGNDAEDQLTMQYIRQFLQATPTIYLPSHDPDAARRLTSRTIVSFPVVGIPAQKQ